MTQHSDRVTDENTTFPMTSASEEGGHIKIPHPQGEVEKVIERLKRDVECHKGNADDIYAKLTAAQAEIEKLRGELDETVADLAKFIGENIELRQQRKAQAEEMRKALEEDGQTITIRERLIDRRYDWQIVAIRPERITTLQSFGPGKAGEEAAIAALSLMKGGER